MTQPSIPGSQIKLLRDHRTLAAQKLAAMSTDDAKRPLYERRVAELDEQITALGG